MKPLKTKWWLLYVIGFFLSHLNLQSAVIHVTTTQDKVPGSLESKYTGGSGGFGGGIYNHQGQVTIDNCFNFQ